MIPPTERAIPESPGREIPLVNLLDFEQAAERRLPKATFDYYAGGALDEVTLRESRAAYERIPLYYRVLVDVERRSLETTALGERVSMPVLVAPMAFQGLAHEDGERATARAVGNAGTIMIASTFSSSSIEDIARAASGSLWFQLYIFRDRAATQDLIQRAEAAGCRAVVVTVDVPVVGPRERDVRNRFALSDDLVPGNVRKAGPDRLGKTPALAAYVGHHVDPAISWRDIDWVRSCTKLPVLVKGIVRADDARRAVDAGVHGILVSNHGGRQLDTAPATIDALPYIADAVAGRVEIYVDGGIRRGADVVKAIARGARAVLLGRPVLWGLAVDGERGVGRVLDILRAEIDNALALCGCTSVSDIGPDLLRP